jgi:nicotinamidase-related amidase
MPLAAQPNDCPVPVSLLRPTRRALVRGAPAPISALLLSATTFGGSAQTIAGIITSPGYSISCLLRSALLLLVNSNINPPPSQPSQPPQPSPSFLPLDHTFCLPLVQSWSVFLWTFSLPANLHSAPNPQPLTGSRLQETFCLSTAIGNALGRRRPLRYLEPLSTMAAPGQIFRPALIVVDFQNDFCPPDGSLAVQQGRDIAPVVNQLLDLPFSLKIATKDWHPQDHVSFASNHSPPNNVPFASEITIQNPHNPEESETTRLWPDHCIQGTKGADLVDELNASKIDHVIEKGQDKRVEMYSAFADPFLSPTVSKSKLEETLKTAGITHVYTVGLATDYCVKFTALDAAKAGFTTVVVEEGTRPVDPAALDDVKAQLAKAGVATVSFDGDEVNRIRGFKG